MNLGSFEIIVIVVLALLLYGRRLPEITRAVGKGYKSFKKEVDGVKDELNKIATFDVDTKTPAERERSPERSIGAERDPLGLGESGVPMTIGVVNDFRLINLSSAVPRPRPGRRRRRR